MKYIYNNDTSHSITLIPRDYPYYANPYLVITADNTIITVDTNETTYDIDLELTNYNNVTAVLNAKYSVVMGVMYVYFDLEVEEDEVFTIRIIGQEIDNFKEFYTGSLKAESNE